MGAEYLLTIIFSQFRRGLMTFEELEREVRLVLKDSLEDRMHMELSWIWGW